MCNNVLIVDVTELASEALTLAIKHYIKSKSKVKFYKYSNCKLALKRLKEKVSRDNRNIVLTDSYVSSKMSGVDFVRAILDDKEIYGTSIIVIAGKSELSEEVYEELEDNGVRIWLRGSDIKELSGYIESLMK